MERRSTFRFRLPWSQSASEPESANKPSTKPNTKTGPNRTSTRQVTRTRTTSQPSSSTATKTSPSSSPTTENSTRKQPPSTTTTAASRRPSSASAGSQGRNEAPTSTTTLTPRSPTPLPQNSAETKAPNQSTTTSTSASPETPPITPQPSAESKAPILSTTNTSPVPESSPVSSQPSAVSKAPIQSSTTNTSRSPETTPDLPQSSSEIKPPIQSSTINAPASPKSETQRPTTTISTNPTSTISQRPQSSPPGVSPSRTESQPLMPSQEQQGITSKPASPSDVSAMSNTSQPPSPSPSRPASQSREMSPKSSPTGNAPQVLSTDQLTPKEASPVSQTSSNLPLGMTSQKQPKDQIIDQPMSPRKQSQESPETYSKSTETLPSISEKAPMTTAVWPQSEQMELLKKEAISDTLTEAKDRSPEKVMQPSELSEMRSARGIAEGPSKISDSSRIISEPKTARPLETNIHETKVKEVVQETNDKNYAAGEKIGGPLTSKEQPDIAFQSKQTYTEKQPNSNNDQIRVNRVSNGKQTRTISSQQRNKSIFNDSRKETAVSSEQDIPLNKQVKDNISKFIHRMAVGDGKQNLEEGPVSVITLAGDNRGASMQLGSDSSRKGRAIQIHRGYKLKSDESTDATTDAEGRQPNDERTMKDQKIEAYMNCNVQGLNNSITFDSVIEGKNPGIHMSFPRKNSETIRSNEETGLFEAHKAEFNVNRAQKHTYEPTIRRRCLEGLFAEPSDSDSDNPEKPRRHGCHVGRMKKRDNDIDIL